VEEGIKAVIFQLQAVRRCEVNVLCQKLLKTKTNLSCRHVCIVEHIARFGTQVHGCLQGWGLYVEVMQDMKG
jgi:hypothetical protein